MIEEVSNLMDQYWSWLRDKTKLREIGSHIEITTPYLDRHNDRLQIYATKSNGHFALTDDGYIIQDLQSSGCELKTKKRRALLETTLNGFGVRLKDDALVVETTPENFAHKKHNLVQAMLAVNDLFYVSSATVANLFWEDVSDWLTLRDVRFTPRVKFTGKSGYDHLFDFVIPASRRAPERIVQAINRPSRDSAQAVAFGWIDTKEVRAQSSKAYAMLNDSEHEPSLAVLDALKNYGVEPIRWSDRESAVQALAAQESAHNLILNLNESIVEDAMSMVKSEIGRVKFRSPFLICREILHDHPSISNREVRELLGLGESPTAQAEASRYLKKWSGPSGFLVPDGNGAKRCYRLRKTS